MNGIERFIGVVQDGHFQALEPAGVAGLRFTAIAVQEAVPPESAELGLAQYEGKAIMISGRPSGGWVYSAEVLADACPLLTAVVQRVFGPARSRRKK